MVSDNVTQFSNTVVINFCNVLGVQTKFISSVQPEVNKQVESANKVIFNGIKKMLYDAQGVWFEKMHKKLWSYHTIPHLTVEETHFTLVYGVDVVQPVEVDTQSWQRSQFDEEKE